MFSIGVALFGTIMYIILHAINNVGKAEILSSMFAAGLTSQYSLLMQGGDSVNIQPVTHFFHFNLVVSSLQSHSVKGLAAYNLFLSF